jgi:hypothetical protein
VRLARPAELPFRRRMTTGMVMLFACVLTAAALLVLRALIA